MQRETVEIHNFNPEDSSTYPEPDRHCGVIIEDGNGKVHQSSGEFDKDRRDWLVSEEFIMEGDGRWVDSWAINSVRQIEPYVPVKRTDSGVEVKPFGIGWIKQIRWFYFPEI